MYFAYGLSYALEFLEFGSNLSFIVTISSTASSRFLDPTALRARMRLTESDSFVCESRG